MKGLTDIPGIRAGHVSDFEAITGCTAILCEQGAVGGVDIRGSASGTQEIDTLSPGHVTDRVHGILLAGGSAFGLEAAAGVRRYLAGRKVGYAFGDVRDPATGKIVAGARKDANSREFVDTAGEMMRGVAIGGTTGNTTLAVVATNAKLNKVQANKLAQFASLGMARAINPVNTMADGDIAFALSLGALQADINILGVAAAEAVAQSILRAVRLAKTLGGVPGLAG